MAATENQGLKEIADDLAAQDAGTVVCETREASMQAVEEGRTDACHIFHLQGGAVCQQRLDIHIMNEPVSDMPEVNGCESP